MGRRERYEALVERETGLTSEEIQTLGTYNAEIARGLIHTAEWMAKMAKLQARFNLLRYDGSQRAD